MAQIITPKDGEEVLASIRKSFTTLSRQIFRFFLMLAPAVLLLVFVSNIYVSGVALLLLLTAFTYAFYHFVVWYYDLYMITNTRILLIEQKGLFTRELSEIDMANVTDVKYRISGVFATMLQRGDVIVTTSGGQTYELTAVADPDYIREMIVAVARTLKKNHGADTGTTEKLLKEVLAKLKR